MDSPILMNEGNINMKTSNLLYLYSRDFYSLWADTMFSFPLESNKEQTALKYEIRQMHGKKQVIGGLDS